MVKGFVKATAKGWQDAIKDPKAAIAALKKHSSLVTEAIETRKTRVADQEPDRLPPNSKADGLGNVRADRFGKSVATVAAAFGCKDVKPADVFDPAYLPDAAIRKLP